MAVASRSAERFTAALLTRQNGAAPVDVLAIPVPGNVFRRGIVAVYPDVYRFYELDWLAAPPLRQTAHPVPRGPDGPVVEAALTAPHVRGMAVWKRFPAYTVDRDRRRLASSSPSRTCATRAAPARASAAPPYTSTAT